MPEAREYLQRAQAIFELKGQVKLLKEVKSKLKLLQPGRYNMAFAEDKDATAQMLGINIAGVVGGGTHINTAGSNPGLESEEDALAEFEEPAPRKGSAQTRGAANKRVKKGSGVMRGAGRK